MKSISLILFFLQLEPLSLGLPCPSPAVHFSYVLWSQRCMPDHSPVQQQASSDCNYSSNILRKGHIPAASIVLLLLCCYLVSLNGRLRWLTMFTCGYDLVLKSLNVLKLNIKKEILYSIRATMSIPQIIFNFFSAIRSIEITVSI